MNGHGDSEVAPSERRRLDEIAQWGQQDPDAAIEYLKACLDGDHGSVDPEQRVEYWLLLAELYAVFGDLIQARARCARAVFEMNRLAEPDVQMVLACLAVAADIAVQVGDSTAPSACFAYMRQTAFDATSSDPSRLVLAGALMAIAEYQQHDCATGKTRLDTVTQKVPDGPLGRVLAAAMAAMDHGCAYPGVRERGPVKPFPGWSLEPSGELPDEDALAARVRQHPGVHIRHDQTAHRTPPRCGGSHDDRQQDQRDQPEKTPADPRQLQSREEPHRAPQPTSKSARLSASLQPAPPQHACRTAVVPHRQQWRPPALYHPQTFAAAAMTDYSATDKLIDTTVAQPARRYDYWLGGKDNFAADRKSGDQLAAMNPNVPLAAEENRRFLQRVVPVCVNEYKIIQFLDIGTGIPTKPNTHQVAQEIEPSARIVYVDNDPLVLVHARALLTGNPLGATAYASADLREPEEILTSPDLLAALDLKQPIALMLLAVLHFIRDDQAALASLSTLTRALAPGSVLALSHGTLDSLPDAERVALAEELDTGRHGETRPRSHDELAGLITRAGWELIEPGIVSIAEWRPDLQPKPQINAEQAMCWGALARLP